MATQSKGVFVTRWQIANAKHTHQGFEFVRHSDYQTNRVARQVVTGEARFVMVFNRFGDIGVQPIVARVVAAHDALQLWKLTHHVGEQIGLGQLRRGFYRMQKRCVVPFVHQTSNSFGDGAHALGTLSLCT